MATSFPWRGLEQRPPSPPETEIQGRHSVGLQSSQAPSMKAGALVLSSFNVSPSVHTGGAWEAESPFFIPELSGQLG